MGSVEVDGIEYEVERTYLRSCNLPWQQLLHDTPENRPACTRESRGHPHNRFYLARNGRTRYWIKEYIWQHRKGTVWEAKQQLRYAGMHMDGGGCSIGPAELVSYDDTRIVMEYLDGYKQLAAVDDSTLRENIVARVMWWLDQTGIRDWDASSNNTMFRGDTIKLIDFEFSTVTNTKQSRLRGLRKGR